MPEPLRATGASVPQRLSERVGPKSPPTTVKVSSGVVNGMRNAPMPSWVAGHQKSVWGGDRATDKLPSLHTSDVSRAGLWPATPRILGSNAVPKYGSEERL